MFSLIRFVDKNFSVVATSHLRKLGNSKSKFLYGSTPGSESTVHLIKTSDNRKFLERWMIKFKSEGYWVDESSDDSSDKNSATKPDYRASTPINLKTYPTLVVRLSDIRKSGDSFADTTRSESSVAPSIPSKLLEMWESRSPESSPKNLIPLDSDVGNSSNISKKQCNDLTVSNNNNSVYSADISSNESTTISRKKVISTKKRKFDKKNFIMDQPTKKQKISNPDNTNLKTSKRFQPENTQTVTSFSTQDDNVSDFNPNTSSLVKSCDSGNTANISNSANKSSSFETTTISRKKVIPTKKRKFDKKNFIMDQPTKKQKISNPDNTNLKTSKRFQPENTQTVTSFSTQDDNDSDFNPNTSSLVKSCDSGNTANISKSVNKSSSFETIIPFNVNNLIVPASKFVPKNESTAKPERTSKLYFCIFCKQLVTKFARHLEVRHKEENAVQEFLKLPVKSHLCLEKITKIRNKGTLLHNTNEDMNSGVLLTSRRCQVGFNRKATDYLPCSKCNAYFSKQTLRIHVKKCIPEHQAGIHDIFSMSRRKVCYIHERADDLLRRSIFPILNDNEVKDIISYDEIIILYGNFLCEKYVHIRHHSMIRSDLRYLGKHKIAIMKLNPEIKEYASIFHPKHVDTAMKALKSVANWNKKKLMFDTPAVATKMTTLVRKVAKRFKSECIKKGKKDEKIAVEEFLDLWKDEVQQLVNRKAIEDQVSIKSQKKLDMPSKKDIKLLYSYVKAEGDRAQAILNKKFDFEAWKSLTECTLILIQIFNRKRAGDIEQLTLDQFVNQDAVGKNISGELFNSLSKPAQDIAKKFVRITNRGKLGRPVSMLVHSYIVVYVDLIKKYRSQAGVKKSNHYLFGRPTRNSLQLPYFRACPLMRKFSAACGAQVPTALRGTNLRKHVATYTAMIGIEETDVERLASFMGHHKDIHKNYYQMPIPLAEMTKVAHLLEIAIGDDKEENESESSSDEEYYQDNNDNKNDANQNLDETFSIDSRNHEKTAHARKKQSRSKKNNEKKTLNSDSENSNQNSGSRVTPIKRKWSDAENNVLIKYFGKLETLQRTPSIKECQKVIRQYDILKNREPIHVRLHVDNRQRANDRKKQYRKKKRSE
ncbi:hypothetical protein KQX54_012127 [Cotesia glomerata]|uniref:Uncharacterized protein n=1 Tax=Cotesia glomerata TaxID=32391 RepID=A0AAV7I8Q8_COTGL|nr:hypothetical protein KQX54_012127 [Cotesia glomerata]